MYSLDRRLEVEVLQILNNISCAAVLYGQREVTGMIVTRSEISGGEIV